MHLHRSRSVCALVGLALLGAFWLSGVRPGSGPVQIARAQTTGVTPTGLQDYERWVGSLHSHVGMDGDDGVDGSTAAQAFAYARNLPHLQYFAVSPHLHASRSGDATLWYENTYDTLRAQAAGATTADFVAMAGVEVGTISKGGHWNLFNAQDLVGQDHPDGDWNDADDYYDHLAGLGAARELVAAQFNHPNTTDFGNRYDANAAPYVGTLAVSSGPAFSAATDFGDSGSNYESVWAHFLSLGWKLAPAADQDNHNATWGASSSEYTVIVRPKGTALTPANVVQGLREHMTYATEDANLQLGFIANGWSMGQTIGGSPNVAFVVWWNNPSATIYNLNNNTARAEAASDAIQNIWLYKNGFSTPVASYQPRTVSGAWAVTVTATAGDWFVVKFQDSSTLATTGRTTDLAWSAPVWYDPAHADVPLTVNGAAPVPVAGVALSGPVSGTVGATSAFTATVTPFSATLPITYVWETVGQAPLTHTGGLSDTAMLAWDMPGTYPVTVTARNAAAGIQASQTMVVVAPPPPTAVAVEGVALSGPLSGTVGSMATFTATVTPLSATLPITYVWAVTGQPPITCTNEGLTSTVTFPWLLARTQEVTVTAVNIQGSATATQPVSVTEPVTGVAVAGVGLSGPAQVLVGTGATFTATVTPPDATVPLTYTWQATGQLPVTHTRAQRNDTVAWTWDTPGIQTFTVTVQNAGGPVVQVAVVTVTAHTLYVPLVLVQR